MGGNIRFDYLEGINALHYNHLVWLTRLRKYDEVFLADLENPWVLQKRQELKVMLRKQFVS